MKTLSACSQQLPIVYLSENATVHFNSPETIQYVDYPKGIAGDLPLKNILRIKYIADSTHHPAVITIAGEKFIAQYQVIFTNDSNKAINTNIEILPSDTRPLDISGIGLSQREMKNYAMRLIARRERGHYTQNTAFGLTGTVSQIYTLGDYIFLDIAYLNKTNLKYDIDEMRFKIEDRKVTKASTIQSVEIKPELILFDIPGFRKRYRNIFVFKKFSFPGNKLLNIEMTEKQISGRVITMSLKYGDLLNADIIR
jgi:conjugative transposon TraN protein